MAATPTSGAIRNTLREYGDMTQFSVATLKELPASGRYMSEVLRQAAILVRGSTLVIFILPFFLGITQTNFSYYVLRAAGAGDYAGLVSGIATPRLSALFMFGYIFAAKVGCGIVAEIGAMKINEEIDAYDSEGISSRRYVVGTRILGALMYTPIAAGVAIFAASVGSYINIVNILSATSAETFNRYHWGNQAIFDQFFGFGVAVMLAVFIIFVSCYYGIRTSGGPAEVGTSVARSLLVNLVGVHIITGVMAFAIYGTDLGLPIGGVGS